MNKLHFSWNLNVTMIKWKPLLKHPKINVNQPDNDRGQTPLYMTSHYGNDKVVKILLEHPDINVNQSDNNDGWTPLFIASQCNHEKVVKLLLASYHPIDLLAKCGYDHRTS